MTKIYIIKGKQMAVTTKKLNCRIDEEDGVKIYYSAIAQAVKGGTLYFDDKKLCECYLNAFCSKDKEAHIVESRLKIDDLQPITKHIYISKHTDYYKKAGRYAV